MPLALCVSASAACSQAAQRRIAGHSRPSFSRRPSATSARARGRLVPFLPEPRPAPPALACPGFRNLTRTSRLHGVDTGRAGSGYFAGVEVRSGPLSGRQNISEIHRQQRAGGGTAAQRPPSSDTHPTVSAVRFSAVVQRGWLIGSAAVAVNGPAVRSASNPVSRLSHHRPVPTVDAAVSAHTASQDPAPIGLSNASPASASINGCKHFLQSELGQTSKCQRRLLAKSVHSMRIVCCGRGLAENSIRMRPGQLASDGSFCEAHWQIR